MQELNSAHKLPDEVLKSIFIKQLTDYQKEILTLISDKELYVLAPATYILAASKNSSNQQIFPIASNQSEVSPSAENKNFRRLENKFYNLIDILKKSIASGASSANMVQSNGGNKNARSRKSLK